MKAVAPPDDGTGGARIQPPRVELERRLDLAIQRARRSYLQAGQPRRPEPSANPPHLGGKVDVRA